MRRLACLGLISVIGGAACASPTFTVNVGGGSDGGSDAHGGEDGTAPSPDGGRDARADGGSAPDATKLLDAEMGTDAEGAKDGQSAKDAPGAKDAGEDSGEHDAGTPDVMTTGGMDSGSADAGPACATKQTNDNIGVYVVAGGATSGMCTRFTPCASLETAMGVATANVYYTIYVAPGTYPATSTLAVKDGITISGGWSVTGNTWTGSCSAGDTPLLTAPTTVLTIGSAGTPSTGAVTLDTIKVQNTATASTAQSVYGVFAVGSGASSLTLNNVGITAPAGGAGAEGMGGAQGGNGATTGCQETAGATPGTGNGATGGAGAEGSYGSSGYTPQSPNSSEAPPGIVGATPAPQIAKANNAIDSCGVPPCPASGTGEVQTGPSLGGCGGAPGTGGFTGGGGGSSIALYLWGEAATIRSGALSAGAGGTGGAGGAGAAGGQPGTPGPTAASVMYIAACTSRNAGGTLVCVAEHAAGHPRWPSGARRERRRYRWYGRRRSRWRLLLLLFERPLERDGDGQSDVRERSGGSRRLARRARRESGQSRLIDSGRVDSPQLALPLSDAGRCGATHSLRQGGLMRRLGRYSLATLSALGAVACASPTFTVTDGEDGGAPRAWAKAARRLRSTPATRATAKPAISRRRRRSRPKQIAERTVRTRSPRTMREQRKTHVRTWLTLPGSRTRACPTWSPEARTPLPRTRGPRARPSRRATTSESSSFRGGAPSGACTRFTPCGSLATAMGVASAAGYYTIYVGPGTYPATSTLAVKDGITISGGWSLAGNVWTGSCSAADAPLLMAPTTVLTVGSAGTPSTGAVTLDTINVQNTATVAAGSAQSFYGVFAVGSGASSLTLNNVGVTAPAAGSGPAGGNGTIGAVGASGGCTETAVGGSSGTIGSAGPPGAYGPSGSLLAPRT